jgi:glutamine synthetase
MLPGSLAEAHQYLLKDQVLCDVLGPHILGTLTNIAEAETDAFRLAVHPWELDRYLATY